MSNNLIERYLYAVTKEVPQKIRADVEKELHGLIMDMAEERAAGGEPSEEMFLGILEELGPPSKMAEQYQPESQRLIISMPYYADYIFILKIVSACVGGSAVLTWMVNFILGTDMTGNIASWIAAEMWNLLAEVFIALCVGFAVVTLLFVFLQRRGVALRLRGNIPISDLPPVPDEKAVIKRSDKITAIILSILFTIIFLWLPERIGFVRADGEVEYIFNTAGVRSYWYLLILAVTLVVAESGFAIYEGRYTKRYALISTIANILSYTAVCIFFMRGEIFNTGVLGKVAEVMNRSTDMQLFLKYRLPVLFLGLIGVCMLIECGFNVWKAFRYDKIETGGE